MNKEDIRKRNEAIKKDYEELNMSTSDLAIKYDVSIRSIQVIAKRENWKRTSKPIRQSPISEKCSKTGELYNTDSYVFIYLVDLEEHGVYIGSTKNIPQRFRVHFADIKKGKHSSRIINELAEENLDYVLSRFEKPTILYVNLNGTRNEMLLKEREYQIKYIDNGYRVLGGIY